MRPALLAACVLAIGSGACGRIGYDVVASLSGVGGGAGASAPGTGGGGGSGVGGAGGSVIGTDMEAVSTSAADTGNQFRYTGGQYIFNMATSGLSTGTWPSDNVPF